MRTSPFSQFSFFVWFLFGMTINQQTKYLQEIKQREKSEVMLRKNQQLLELFVRRAPAAIAMLDCQMHYLLVSDYELLRARLCFLKR